MAYKQSPGRGNNAKTGHGIPTPFKQEKIIKAQEEGAKIVSSRKSLKNLNPRELSIETGAASDSIIAANPKKPYLYTKREKEIMGHKAAEETRKINKATTSVERTEVNDSRTGSKDVYKRKPIGTPVKQTKMKKC